MKTQKLQAIKVIVFCGVFLLFMANCNDTQTGAQEKLEHGNFHDSSETFVSSAQEGDLHADDVQLSGAELNEELLDAAGDGDLERVKALIAQDADVDARDEDGKTPLIIAGIFRHWETVKYLVEQGADIDAVDKELLMTPLHYAVRFNNPAMITYLIQKEADTSKMARGETAFTMAAFRGHVEALKACIDAGVDVNAVNEFQMTALIIAAVEGHTDIVKLLLKADADMEFQPQFRESGQDILGGTAFIQAAGKGRAGIVKLLLDAGANIEAPSSSGTALIEAAGKGHSDVVKLLLNAGANIEAVSPDRDTAFIRAKANGHTDIVTLLSGAREKPGFMEKGTTFTAPIDEAKQLMQGWRPSKYIENDFKDQEDVVVDRVTGLMWQKSGSGWLMTYDEARAYITALNRDRFAGYDDWRLPTIEELASLLKPETQALYINPLFDATQAQCWSADTLSKGPALIVSFNYGNVDWCSLNLSCGYVRAVRDDMPYDSEAEIHPQVRLRAEPLTLSTDEVTQLFKGSKESKTPTPTPQTQSESGSRTPVRLRSEPLTVSYDEVKQVFKVKEKWRPREYIENDFEERGEIVVDHATGLMWQKKSGLKSGNEILTPEDVQAYVKRLNHERFAGYDDWRLPTIEELMSLLEPEAQSQGLYINPIFDATWMWSWCWSADQDESGAEWGVAFDRGGVGQGDHNCVYAVRP